MQIKHLLQSGLLAASVACGAAGPERGAVLVQQHRDHRDGAGSRQEEVAVAERAAGHGRHRHHDEAHRGRGAEPARRPVLERRLRHLGAYRQHLQPYRPRPGQDSGTSSAVRTTCGSAPTCT
ncbi:hypothetical protein WJ970_22425 [Achromobacter xylosoxidans]